MHFVTRKELGAALVALALVAAAPPCRGAQSAPGSASAEAGAFAGDVVFVVRVDGAALASSPLLPQLLRRPEAANGLAQALGRSATLAKVRAVYVGLPSRFTPASTELPVLVVGDFSGSELVADLASARGVKLGRHEGRDLLEATGGAGTTYAAALGDGRLAVGDFDSVLRMLEVWERKRPAGEGVSLSALSAVGADVVGSGRIPPGLRDYLKVLGGAGLSLAAVDRASFEGSLGQAVSLRASLHLTTAESRQAIQQALGALVMFGPSRFANDPEVLSAIQSLRFGAVAETLDLTMTIPRSLLLRLLDA